MRLASTYGEVAEFTRPERVLPLSVTFGDAILFQNRRGGQPVPYGFLRIFSSGKGKLGQKTAADNCLPL